tara:strand:+ start:248 stop:412 length:165 start_codon:yes stop_codon:yes gene_type:complete
MPKRPKKVAYFGRSGIAPRIGTGTGRRGKGKKGEPLFGSIVSSRKMKWNIRRKK